MTTRPSDQPALFALAEAAPPAPPSGTGGALPRWLLERLQAHPRTDPRRTRWDTCPRCAQVVLTGDDDDRTAIRATVDPTPLDLLAEAQAILTGRALYQAIPARTAATDHTFKLHRVSPHPQHRGPGIHLLPGHVCGRPLAPPALIAPDPGPRHPDDPAPF